MALEILVGSNGEKMKAADIYEYDIFISNYLKTQNNINCIVSGHNVFIWKYIKENGITLPQN